MGQVIERWRPLRTQTVRFTRCECEGLELVDPRGFEPLTF